MAEVTPGTISKGMSWTFRLPPLHRPAEDKRISAFEACDDVAFEGFFDDKLIDLFLRESMDPLLFPNVNYIDLGGGKGEKRG